MKRVAIIDYGYGNLFSVKNALSSVNLEPFVTNNSSDITTADAVVIPGVGNYSYAVKELGSFRSRLREFVENGGTVFGICLGLQLLCRESEEGEGKGLSFLDASVKKISADIVPHMGWNSLSLESDSELLGQVIDESYVYFVHSYCVEPVNSSIVRAVTYYGEKITAVVEDGSLLGTQFHPEKSGPVGLQILDNFAGILRR